MNTLVEWRCEQDFNFNVNYEYYAAGHTISNISQQKQMDFLTTQKMDQYLVLFIKINEI